MSLGRLENKSLQLVNFPGKKKVKSSPEEPNSISVEISSKSVVVPSQTALSEKSKVKSTKMCLDPVKHNDMPLPSIETLFLAETENTHSHQSDHLDGTSSCIHNDKNISQVSINETTAQKILDDNYQLLNLDDFSTTNFDYIENLPIEFDKDQQSVQDDGDNEMNRCGDDLGTTYGTKINHIKGEPVTSTSNMMDTSSISSNSVIVECERLLKDHDLDDFSPLEKATEPIIIEDHVHISSPIQESEVPEKDPLQPSNEITQSPQNYSETILVSSPSRTNAKHTNHFDMLTPKTEKLIKEEKQQKSNKDVIVVTAAALVVDKRIPKKERVEKMTPTSPPASDDAGDDLASLMKRLVVVVSQHPDDPNETINEIYLMCPDTGRLSEKPLDLPQEIIDNIIASQE